LRHLGRLAPAELHARMAEAAIFAAPARYEPFGLGILEAATQGCALVLGEVPSLVELWKDAARFVPPGEPEALRAALEGLIADAGARERLADAARERAAAYTRARMTEGYLGLYADLLAVRRVVRGRAA
jgi:glycosyltransferase involved in cell wall biosynthesis